MSSSVLYQRHHTVMVNDTIAEAQDESGARGLFEYVASPLPSPFVVFTLHVKAGNLASETLRPRSITTSRSMILPVPLPMWIEAPGLCNKTLGAAASPLAYSTHD